MAKRRRKLILMIIASGLLLALATVHFLLPRVVTKIRSPLMAKLTGNPHQVPNGPSEMATDRGAIFTVQSFDGTAIVAHQQYSALDTTYSTMLLLHGIRSNKENLSHLAYRLAQKGYSTVAVDLRAHGYSGGTHCTFGVKERKDISAVIDHLEDQEMIKGSLGIFGQSLGGAIAIQSLAIDDRLKYGIILSAFSTFRSITDDYFRFNLGFSYKWLSNYLVDRAGAIAGFDPDDASPLEYCKLINQPVLMAHGLEDRRITIEYGKENFKNLADAQSEFLTIENANHLDVWQVGGELFLEKILAFLTRHGS